MGSVRSAGQRPRDVRVEIAPIKPSASTRRRRSKHASRSKRSRHGAPTPDSASASWARAALATRQRAAILLFMSVYRLARRAAVRA